MFAGIKHKKNQPAVHSARGGLEGRGYGCVLGVQCNIVQYVSVTDMPRRKQRLDKDNWL